MNCFPCFQKKSSNNDNNYNLPVAQIKVSPSPPPPVFVNKHASTTDLCNKAEASNTKEEDTTAKAFTFRELAMATKNFRQECLLGEGGFGKVFRGTLKSSGQIIAVRQLDRSGTQGSKEFQAEILNLSLLEHPNLVHIIGYCADGDQRLLVNEYMPSGSLKNHLFDNPPNRKPLDWSLRMKIAAGIAEGLEYLHEKVNPPIIYQDLKSSNILLDETNKPRLSEYGLAKLVQSGNKMHVTTYGYCAPEYERHGELTLKSDVYSFGVVLLELITGRKALDTSRPMEEQNLVSWAQPIFGDPKRFPDMADPLLIKKFPVTSLNQAVGVAAMCLQEEPMVRPLIGDIVAALSFLSMAPPEAPIPDRLLSILSFSSRASVDVGIMSRRKKESISHNEHKHQKNHPKEHKNYEQEFDGSSDSDSSVRSRLEERHGVEESGKWGSGSKHCSNRSSSSIGSQDLSDCDSDSSSDEEFSRHGKYSDRQMTINSRTNSSKKSSGSYSRKSSFVQSQNGDITPRDSNEFRIR